MYAANIHRTIRSLFTLITIIIATSCVKAQPPAGYYDAADGVQGGAALKTAFFNIIKNPDVVSYKGLWKAFETTDKRPDNGKVWDMYSDVPNGTAPYYYTFGTNQCGGSFSNEGDCYNREHSFPSSWFNKAKPMYSDLFHLYPTDGTVNNKRADYPFGEVGVWSWKSQNGSLVGKNTFGSYRGTVFEPIDTYKGDFARTYFYMVTAYEDRVAGWDSPHLAGNAYPALSDWSVDLLLKWHREDPVSQKEINRNEAVYKLQGNRNPYIDFPDLAEYVWGNKTTEIFTIDGASPPTPSPTVSSLETDFKSSLLPFTEYSVSGNNQEWQSNPKFGAKMSGYENGIAYVNEDWLISPQLDLTDAESAKLSFSHAIKFTSKDKLKTDHTLWISENYSAENPTAATWTQLTIPSYPSGNDWIYVESGEINFPSQFLGKENVHIAFKYLSNDVQASTWEISPLKIEISKTTSGIKTATKKSLKIIAREGAIYVDLQENPTFDTIEIYSTQGVKKAEKHARQGINRIPIGISGVYIVKVGDRIRKILVQ